MHTNNFYAWKHACETRTTSVSSSRGDDIENPVSETPRSRLHSACWRRRPREGQEQPRVATEVTPSQSVPKTTTSSVITATDPRRRSWEPQFLRGRPRQTTVPGLSVSPKFGFSPPKFDPHTTQPARVGNPFYRRYCRPTRGCDQELAPWRRSLALTAPPFLQRKVAQRPQQLRPLGRRVGGTTHNSAKAAGPAGPAVDVHPTSASASQLPTASPKEESAARVAPRRRCQPLSRARRSARGPNTWHAAPANAPCRCSQPLGIIN